MSLQVVTELSCPVKYDAMNISDFFSSYPGMYMTQTFCHSLIAFIIIDRAMHLWDIKNPLFRQRFQIMVVLLPVISFPLYQLINPDRGSISFRLESLFDVNRWLNLELWGAIPLGVFFLIIIFITSLIFFFQEMVPILLHMMEAKRSEIETEKPDADSVISKAIERLPVEKPDIFVLDDDDFVLFSTTGRKAAVYVSTGVIHTLNVDQIQAAVVHEIAHIERNKKPLLLIVFVFRVIMFFNPVVLIEFRRLVQEEEKICDDMAVILTKKPHAMSEVLEKLYRKTQGTNSLKSGSISEMKDIAEDYSHNAHIESRIIRLEPGIVYQTGSGWFQLVLAAIAIMGINYFVL